MSLVALAHIFVWLMSLSNHKNCDNANLVGNNNCLYIATLERSYVFRINKRHSTTSERSNIHKKRLPFESRFFNIITDYCFLFIRILNIRSWCILHSRPDKRVCLFVRSLGIFANCLHLCHWECSALEHEQHQLSMC